MFEKQVSFSGKTQLKGGTFLRGIIVEPGEQALALLADGYAFADADTNEILNVSHVSLRRQNVKVVEHTCIPANDTITFDNSIPVWYILHRWM